LKVTAPTIEGTIMTTGNGHDMGTLLEDARALMAATAGVAEDRVREARKRLADSLDGGRTLLGKMRDKAVEGARATDHAVHEYPYPVIAIGVGVGVGVGVALFGYLMSRRRMR
jgi:ElaB/YqjD/DUF883 family membrane-anchored ribosome-binding protein